jgi:hypothetical protein
MQQKDFRVKQTSISPFQQNVMKGAFANIPKRILYRVKTIGAPMAVRSFFFILNFFFSIFNLRLGLQ